MTDIRVIINSAGEYEIFNVSEDGRTLTLAAHVYDEAMGNKLSELISTPVPVVNTGNGVVPPQVRRRASGASKRNSLFWKNFDWDAAFTTILSEHSEPMSYDELGKAIRKMTSSKITDDTVANHARESPVIKRAGTRHQDVGRNRVVYTLA